MHPRIRRILAVLCAITALIAAGAPGSTAGPPRQPTPPPVERYFPETGHWVRGRFLTYWEQHGGLAQQGYPLSEELTEVSDLDGKPYTVQYFERALFEYHPENQPPYDVLLSQLGTFRYRARYAGSPLPTSTPQAAPVCGTWQTAPLVGRVGQYIGLHAVAATGPNDAWAVGLTSDKSFPDLPSGVKLSPGAKTLILHWDGTTWIPVPSPGTQGNRLNGVVALAPDNAWAVGEAVNGDKDVQGLFLHWDGSAWHTIDVRDYSGITPRPALLAIAATDADNIIALQTGGHLIHWEDRYGGAWADGPGPVAMGHGIGAIAVRSKDDIWGVGAEEPEARLSFITSPFIGHWDKHQWQGTLLTDYGARLSAVALTPGGDLWAVGDAAGQGPPSSANGHHDIEATVLHGTGGTWTYLDTPDFPQAPTSYDYTWDLLKSVVALADNDVWAVGYRQFFDNSVRQPANPLIQHWNGAAWRTVSAPALPPGDNRLAAIGGRAGSLWAVGRLDSEGAQVPLILHYEQAPCGPAPTATP